VHASPVRALLTVLVAASTILLIVGVSVALFLNPIWFGFEQERTGAAAYTGFTPAQVREVMSGVLRDLVIGPPDFAQVVDDLPVFTARERSHLVDVRGVFAAFGAFCLLAGLTLVNARLASRGARWFRRSAGAGASLLGVAVVIGAVIVSVAFEQAFEVFHRLFFAGGTYTFDSATDRLVQLLPESLWVETSIAVGAVILVISSAVAWWGLRRRSEA
jgi:integral membrane protein (TIGR01906 family)